MKTEHEIRERILYLSEKIEKKYPIDKKGLGQDLCKAIDPDIKELNVLKWVMQDKVEEIFKKHFENRTFTPEAEICVKNAIKEALQNKPTF